MYLIPIGTKAQLIKMAPIMRELKNRNIDYHFILTGQHNETMLDIVSEFGLTPPDSYWASPKEADTKTKLLQWFFLMLKVVLIDKSLPTNTINGCLVHGDTLSTLVATLYAKKRKIKIIHIEAGLRSFNYANPFPEEIIRVLVTKLSHTLMCPDQTSFNNIKIRKNQFKHITGNSHYDAVKFIEKKEQPQKNNEYLLASFHRTENLQSKTRLNNIINILVNLSKKTTVVIVLHPTTKHALAPHIERLTKNNITLINRVKFGDFINLIKGSKALLTDGGSNQEECSYLGIPCILLRSHTERDDGLENNTLLSNYNLKKIESYLKKIDDTPTPPPPQQSPSKKIVDLLQLSHEK